MAPTHAIVEARLNEIEAEMKRLGWWSATPPPPEAFNFTRAFAGDTMAYSQWLQFVFVPRVREIIAARGTFPPASHVGAQAVREFDGMDEADGLIRALSAFDALFVPQPKPGLLERLFGQG